MVAIFVFACAADVQSASARPTRCHFTTRSRKSVQHCDQLNKSVLCCRNLTGLSLCIAVQNRKISTHVLCKLHLMDRLGAADFRLRPGSRFLASRRCAAWSIQRVLKRAQSFEFLINLRGRTKYYDKLDRIYRCLRLEENLSGAWLVKRCRYYRPTPNEL